jgi:cysteine desulfurase/selenocysteine lyase
MPPDFPALRQEFPATERWTHLDVARKAPLPRCAERAMHEFMRDVHERAGETAFSMEQVEEARRVVARLVGVPEETLAFIRNTSEGLNILAQGLGLEAGDKVLLSELEHENNVYPWRRLEKQGVEVGVVRAREGRLPVEAFVEEMDPRTRVVTVSWVAYANGCRTDLPGLGRACRERGILLIVDGIQGVGVLNTPLTDLGADAVVCGGHKALLGLAGAGFMYCRQELIPKVDPPYAAKFSFTTNDRWARNLELSLDAHRFEYGSPNHLGIWVLRRSAELIMRIGLEHIEARVRALTTQLFTLAADRGIAIATPQPWQDRAGIVGLQIPDPEKTALELRARNILVSAKNGQVLRVAPHFYNTEAEVERLVEALTYQ